MTALFCSQARGLTPSLSLNQKQRLLLTNIGLYPCSINVLIDFVTFLLGFHVLIDFDVILPRSLDELFAGATRYINKVPLRFVDTSDRYLLLRRENY